MRELKNVNAKGVRVLVIIGSKEIGLGIVIEHSAPNVKIKMDSGEILEMELGPFYDANDGDWYVHTVDGEWGTAKGSRLYSRVLSPEHYFGS